MTDYTKYYLKTRKGIVLGIAKVNEKGVLHYGEIVDLLNSLYEENKYLKKRFKAISDELYCKDRKLEELGVPIECCDKDE